MQSGFGRPSSTPRTRWPPAARDRRPCWPSCRSCSSWKPSDAMPRPCPRARPAGSPACATTMSHGRWPCCIATLTRSWTADDLGREVGLSRSALAERFTRLIGVAPMHYLANWRMQVAAQELRHAQHLAGPGRQQGRLRIRGRLLTRIQEGLRHGTGHVATFEESDRFELRPLMRVGLTFLALGNRRDHGEHLHQLSSQR